MAKQKWNAHGRAVFYGDKKVFVMQYYESSDEYFKSCENAQLIADALESIRAIADEWSRQKNLFSELSKDGEMDMKIKRAELLTLKMTGEYVTMTD